MAFELRCDWSACTFVWMMLGGTAFSCFCFVLICFFELIVVFDCCCGILTVMQSWRLCSKGSLIVTWTCLVIVCLTFCLTNTNKTKETCRGCDKKKKKKKRNEKKRTLCYLAHFPNQGTGASCQRNNRQQKKQKQKQRWCRVCCCCWRQLVECTVMCQTRGRPTGCSTALLP